MKIMLFSIADQLLTDITHNTILKFGEKIKI